MEGIPDAIVEPVTEAVENVLNGNSKRSSGDDLKEQVRIAARRAANDIWGKKPVVRVQTVEI
jgi:ribonuclease J